MTLDEFLSWLHAARIRLARRLDGGLLAAAQQALTDVLAEREEMREQIERQADRMEQLREECRARVAKAERERDAALDAAGQAVMWR